MAPEGSPLERITVRRQKYLAEEAESTKRKELEVREVEIHETNATKRQRMICDQPNSSTQVDSTFNYYANIWNGNASFVTAFDTILSLERPESSDRVFDMPWVTASSTKEEEYQNDSNEFLMKFGTSQIDKEKLVVFNPQSFSIIVTHMPLPMVLLALRNQTQQFISVIQTVLILVHRPSNYVT
jgi:hypothetical protein